MKQTPGTSLMDILSEAASIVGGARQQDYGTPLANHQRTADLWNAYLRCSPDEKPQPLTPRDVCMLNILQKVSRDRHAPKRDNLVDIAGYARNAELCEQPQPAPQPQPPQAVEDLADFVNTVMVMPHRYTSASGDSKVLAAIEEVAGLILDEMRDLRLIAGTARSSVVLQPQPQPATPPPPIKWRRIHDWVTAPLDGGGYRVICTSCGGEKNMMDFDPKHCPGPAVDAPAAPDVD